MQPYQQLEIEFAEWNGLDPAGMVVCSSGTAALHLALEALRLPAGSEVVVPDFTMIACARAVTLAGLEPVFVDCDDSLSLNPALVEMGGIQRSLPPSGWRYVDRTVRAVLAVHIYGRRCDIGRLASLVGHYSEIGQQAAEFDDTAGELYLIEDLAEAHGVKPHPDTDAACWSFFRNKHIHGEEGGAVWFRDPAHATLARQLRNMGFTDEHDYIHISRGHNYRLANCLASLVLDSLRRFDAEMARRRRAEAILDDACPGEWRMPPRAAPWVYDLRIPGLRKIPQDRVIQILKSSGIEARHGFAPMHWQPEYVHCRRVGGCEAELASQEVIYLPMDERSLPGLEVIRRVLG